MKLRVSAIFLTSSRGPDPAVYPRFDIYPKALQITEALKREVDLRLANVGDLTAEYPNMIICK